LSVPAEAAARKPRALQAVGGGLLDALSFLTILPMPARVARGERFALTAAVPWFPVVGALAGGFAGGLRVAFDPLLGRGPSSALAMVGLVAISGALHQDALADLADGVGARGDAQRRLEVMRDPRVGTFGALALILWALLLFTSLERLGSDHALLTLVAAAASGRLAAPLQALMSPPARADGLGAQLRASAPAAAAASLAAAAIAIAAVGPLRGGLSCAVAVLAAFFTARTARRTFGGVTGDTLGAGIALTEVGVCLLLASMWR
jgi:adenosylcobinamide-GDP ribazoletransferase